jgi:hypothetical protein
VFGRRAALSAIEHRSKACRRRCRCTRSGADKPRQSASEELYQRSDGTESMSGLRRK